MMNRLFSFSSSQRNTTDDMSVDSDHTPEPAITVTATPIDPSEPISTSVSLQCEPEYNAVPHNEEMDSFMCLASVVAPTHEPDDGKRPGMDIVAVLDRSGSMSGQKMAMLHQTCEIMISQLKATDRLSLVSYDDQVETPLTLTQMDAKGKRRALEALKKVFARSMTNLSGGLMRGMDIVQECGGQSGNDVVSVLLLTDGLANSGITNHNQLVELTRKRISSMKHPTSLYTFGLGSDHDAKLLGDLAEAGKGGYYFVENADTVSSAFGDCLGGLMSVVAQNIEVQVSPAPGVEIRRVHTRFPTTTGPNGSTLIQVGDVMSEERKDILVDVKLPSIPCPTEHWPVLTISSKALNIITGQTDNLEAAVLMTRSEVGTKRQGQSLYVDEQRNRLHTADVMEEARKLGDQGQLAEARNLLEACCLDNERSVSAVQSAALTADLKSAQLHMRTVSDYKARGGHKLSSKARKHHYQRAMECEEAEAANDLYTNCSRMKTKMDWRGKSSK